jgi:hypothetical protein
VALLIIDEGELLPDKAWYELTTYMNCRSDMKVFITGTPNNTVDMFSKLCTDPSTGFEQIQYSVLQNPDPKFNQAGLNQIKAGCLPEDWKSQWLAEATVK